ncbi:MAG: IDEAL domain-containing protein [Ectobacillus sp.]
MEKDLLNGLEQSEVMDTLFAEMVLDYALRSFQKEQILKEIDASLESGNKERFLQLTEELKSFL